jgi:hypothetical protein
MSLIHMLKRLFSCKINANGKEKVRQRKGMQKRTRRLKANTSKMGPCICNCQDSIGRSQAGGPSMAATMLQIYIIFRSETLTPKGVGKRGQKHEGSVPQKEKRAKRPTRLYILMYIVQIRPGGQWATSKCIL